KAYCGTYDHAYQLDLNSRAIKTLNKDIFRVSVLAFSPDKKLLTGTLTGLYYLKDSDFVPYPDSRPIFRTRITDIKIKDENMYLATRERGIAIVTRDSIYSISTNEGLTSDNVKKILLDDDIVWAATSRGISRIIIIGFKPFRFHIDHIN